MFTGLHKALFLENAARTVLLPVDCVLPSPWQPRRQFEAGALDNLADNIRQHGLLQPIAVRVLGGGLLKEQDLFFGEVGIDERHSYAVESQIPGSEPRILPAVGHQNYLG